MYYLYLFVAHPGIKFWAQASGANAVLESVVTIYGALAGHFEHRYELGPSLV